MPLFVPTWRSFQTLPCDAEAAVYSAACLYSLATLRIATSSGASRFALTEQKQPGVWRWATYSLQGGILDEGWEPGEAEARNAAVEALQWETA
jgi:hypothetical protein